MPRLLFLAAFLALSACAESEEASLVPIEEGEVYNKIDPIEAAAAPDELELSLGEWRQGLQDDRPALLFGPAGTAPLFSLRCDDRQGLLLQRPGVVPAGETQMMTITLGTTSRQLAVNPIVGPVPLLRASVPAGDDLLNQIANAEVPITVAIGDDPTLNLPPSPLIGALIRSCALEAPPAPEAPVEAGNSSAPAEPGQ